MAVADIIVTGLGLSPNGSVSLVILEGFGVGSAPPPPITVSGFAGYGIGGSGLSGPGTSGLSDYFAGLGAPDGMSRRTQ